MISMNHNEFTGSVYLINKLIFKLFRIQLSLWMKRIWYFSIHSWDNHKQGDLISKKKKHTHNLVKEDTDDQWAAYTWKNKERDKMLSLNAKSIADKRLRRDLKSDKFADKTSKNLTESGSTLTHTEVVPKSPTKCMEAILKKHSNICMYKRTDQTCYLSIMKSIQTSSFSK